MKRMTLAALSILALALALAVAGCGAAKHKIALDVSEDYFVESCPTSAETGEKVVVHTCQVEDGDVHVAVDGDAKFGEFTSYGVYEFTMPDHDVTVHVWITSNGLA